MKRRSYLSSREPRSFLRSDLRNAYVKIYFVVERRNRKFFLEKFGSNRDCVERSSKGWLVASLDREYRRDTLEISRRIRIIHPPRVKQEGDRIVRFVSEIQSMPDRRMPLTC